MFRKTLIILAMLFAILGPGAEAWGQTTYTISFVKGTTNGTDISTQLPTNASTMCQSGSNYIASFSGTNAYYNTNGCGIRLAKSKEAGSLVITLSDDIQTATIKEVIIYASAVVSGNTLDVTPAGTVTTKTTFSSLSTYSTSADISTYAQSAISINGTLTSLTFGAASKKYVHLHKIDIVTAPTKTLESIAISGTPNKTTYEAGESFDPAGLVVTGTYDDESQETITSGITWNVTPNPLTVGTTSVSVTATVSEITSAAYQVDGLTVNQHVVTPGTYEIIPNNTFFGIEVQTTGSHGSVTGTQNDITITHSGGTSFYCNASQVRTYKNNTLTFSVPTGYEITSIVLAVTDNASYSANVGTYTANTKTWTGSAQEIVLTSGQSSGNYQITKITVTFVAKKTLQSIAVKTPPTKTTYNVGENFDPAGLVITATYDTGDPEDIAYAGNEDKFSFSPALDAALATTDENVTITYGGKETTQAITVSKIKLATPANLQATDMTPTSATLTWDEVTGASSYEVKLNGEVKTAETNSLLVEELTASTTYTWTVKAIGNETTYDDSEASAESNFTTLAPPSVAYTVTFDGNEHGTPARESITETEAGAGVTLPNCTPNTGYQFVGWATTNTATEADAGVAGKTYNPTENIILYAVYNEVYTITWSVNGAPTTDGNPTTSVVKGDGITTLPTAPASISGMAFQGWTATQIATSSATAPTDLFTDAEHAPAITANTTFYAVFAEESEGEATWTEITSIPEAGTYAILTTSYFMKAQITNNRFANGSATPAISNNKLTTAPAEDCIWEISKPDTYYRIKNGNNYAGGTNSKNQGALLTDANSDLAKWSISYNSGFTIINYGRSIATSDSNNKYLRNNTNNGWATYASTTGDAPRLFKKIVTYTYTNFCTTVIVKELTSISFSGDYPTEFWKGETFSHEGMTVTAHYSNADDEDVTDKATFTGYDMAAAGEQTVTVTYEGKTETYSITVKTIANTQETAYTVAEAKAIIDAGKDLGTEVYVKGTVSKVDGINDGAITYWLDNNTFEVYKGKNVGDEAFTNVNQISVNDDVIIYGKIKKYYSTYEFDAGNYLVSHIRVATLLIDDITVSFGGEIEPVITSNVPEAERRIAYSVANEDVVKVNEEGKLVTVAVGGPVEVTATLTAEGYKGAETTFTVEVIKALQSIAVKTAPTTVSYKEGDFFNPAGLVITLTYSDATAEDVEYAGNEDNFTFTPSLETPLTKENTSVTITYAGKDVIQTITVRELYTYDITWMANGEQFATTQVTEGDALVLPTTNPDNVGDMVFQGWYTDNYYDPETAPEYIVPSGIIPTGAMTFYAVYAKEHKDIQEMTSTMDFSEETYSDWTVDEKITRTADQGTGGTGDYAGKINTNDSYITFNDKVKVESFGFSFKRTSNNENYYVYIETSTDNETWEPRQTYPMKDFGNGSYTTKTDDTFDGETEMYVRFHCSNITAIRYVDDVIIKYIGEDITYSNFCTTVAPIVISENTVWDGNVTINGNTTVTIGSGAVLTVKGALINTNPEKLIIKDGGQLVFNNSGKDNNIKSGVKATVEKNIVPYGSSKGDKGWHFLAAPMTNFAVESFINQANGNYDLYRWYIKDNGDPIWYNYKAHTSDFETNFVSGRGYLAAYETTNLLKMQGTLNAGTEFTFAINTKGNFTLLGNPFTYDLNWSEFNNKTGIYDGFAVVDSEDGIIKYAVGDTPIKVGTGFMVYTEDDGAELSFTKGSGSGKSNDILALNLFASNGNGEDNTIIVIDDNNGGFAKADNFNTNVPQIYTERLQTKYGIRNFNTSTKEFNVSFKAVGEGSNTIRLETIGEFDYVHLYDKLTDVDVDMLLEGSYTFEASEDDDTHRFIVRIDKGNTGIDENETEDFVNVYNGEIHVSGRGEVQIFDVMGRMMHSEVISGDATISTGGFKGGVYVVRLIGDGWTKTEKIVVRR